MLSIFKKVFFRVTKQQMGGGAFGANMCATDSCFYPSFLPFSTVAFNLRQNPGIHSIACACVFTESCLVHFTCNFVETTAGTFILTTALSFTYCITLGWIHMLYASSAASISSGPCVPSYHITALWQVSDTSQAGFYHVDTAVSSFSLYITVQTFASFLPF